MYVFSALQAGWIVAVLFSQARVSHALCCCAAGVQAETGDDGQPVTQ